MEAWGSLESSQESPTGFCPNALLPQDTFQFYSTTYEYVSQDVSTNWFLVEELNEITIFGSTSSDWWIF
jgi:hypothetical protein